MKYSRIFLLIVFWVVSISGAQAHPYHVSIAELRYNPKNQMLEIALKVFTDDLEKTLSETAKKPVTLSQNTEVKNQLAAYLMKAFQVENAQKQVLPQRFIGFETEADAQWLYLEIPVNLESLKQIKLRNQILLETYSDQMNLVNLTINGQKKTLIFKEDNVLQPLY